jgi:MFS family permease
MSSKMKSPQITKLYISHILAGLVFWYGIEKLFMQSIGINPLGVGLVTAALTVVITIFDIPAGILADKWSRRGVLVISALALAVASLICGESHGLPMYFVGDLFFGLYVVTSGGTYQAIIYDSLHEEGRAEHYSQINGRIFAVFLVGAGIGDVASGFLVNHYGLRAPYLLTVVSCLLNVAVLLTLHEPKFHKAEHKERMLTQLHAASVAISKLKLLRVLVVVVTALAIVELFKLEFSQLYMFRYVTAPMAIGLLWAAFAFAMAVGSMVAHRLRSRLNVLIIASVVPLLLMSFIDNWFSLVLFMVQAVAASALINQIDTRIQENTPSNVRASILSVVSTFGRAISIPASFILGWLFRDYDSLTALRFVAGIAGLTLLYWLVSQRSESKLAEI